MDAFQTPAGDFYSLAAIGFPGLEHTEVETTPKGRQFIWLRAIGEEAVEVELPKSFEAKAKLFERFADIGLQS